MYWKYLKTHGIPWAMMTYGILKAIAIYSNGFSAEFTVGKIAYELVIWFLAAVVYALLLWYTFYYRKLKDQKEKI